MAQFSASKSKFKSGDFEILPTDIYRMKIAKADIQQDQFAEPDENGDRPDQLVLCWEVSQVIGEQDEGVVGLSVWQRMAPWYGVGKRGPSKFKAFVDGLIAQNLLSADFDPDNMDTDWFVGVEQRVNVEEYTKTMGMNKGQPGNRIVNILPLVAAKKAPTKVAPAQPLRKNTPQPVTAGDIDDGAEGELPF